MAVETNQSQRLEEVLAFRPLELTLQCEVGWIHRNIDSHCCTDTAMNLEERNTWCLICNIKTYRIQHFFLYFQLKIAGALLISVLDY
jgi:hypothetical protein